jgi:hypothetical protein
MSTAGTEAPAAGAAPHGQTAQPELKDAGVAPQQGEESQGSDQPRDAEGEDKDLTDEQKAIRKMQRRIDRLTAKRGGTERENELLRQQLSDLERRLQTATSHQGDGDEGQGEPKPKGRQFTEADIERMAQARAKELHQQTSISQRVAKVLDAGSKLEGFNAAVDAVAEVVPFTDRQGRPTAFIEAVLDADAPAALLKYLGENPEEAEDLVDLSPAQLGRRLAKLEDRLKADAKKATSAAPKPLKPVNGNSSGGGNEPDPEKDAEAWIRSRNKQAAART